MPERYRPGGTIGQSLYGEPGTPHRSLLKDPEVRATPGSHLVVGVVEGCLDHHWLERRR
jgi:hypothetical protein